MVTNDIIGKFVTLRSADESDAEFSLKIRQTTKALKYMPPLNVSIDQQTEWIKKQRKLEGDYFFIALNNDGERIGVLSVYDIDDKKAEIGRVVMQGKSCESLEAWLLLLEFSFDTLNLCEVSAYVKPDNARAIRFYKFFGGTAVKNSTAVRNFPFIEMSFNAVSFLEHKQEVIQKILLN